jgi:hypothetical protein
VWIDFREGVSAETVARQIAAAISSYIKSDDKDDFALGYVDKQWVRELSIHFVLTAFLFFVLAVPSMYFMEVFSRWRAVSLFFGLGGAALLVAGINSIFFLIEVRFNKSSAFFLASTDIGKTYIVDPFRKRNRRFIDSLSNPLKTAIVIGGYLMTFSSILAIIFLGYGLFQAMVFLLESGWVNR